MFEFIYFLFVGIWLCAGAVLIVLFGIGLAYCVSRVFKAMKG